MPGPLVRQPILGRLTPRRQGPRQGTGSLHRPVRLTPASEGTTEPGSWLAEKQAAHPRVGGDHGREVSLVARGYFDLALRYGHQPAQPDS
ncbi:hypothetical protein OG226_11960 [Streptomyces sp. NBC_01261]|uniref:hypothetical protein n=1 Tax=Streptomyces sp. NBC_01261 TaxID=2903802 RepID=UPI002E378EA4|nr:hypothetical protein [Streptomyces sp. NBC_01261]